MHCYNLCLPELYGYFYILDMKRSSSGIFKQILSSTTLAVNSSMFYLLKRQLNFLSVFPIGVDIQLRKYLISPLSFLFISIFKFIYKIHE